MCYGMEALYLAIGSTAFNAMGKIQEGQQKKQLYDYQAAQADADAQAEREMGMVRADKVRKAGQRTQSEATAALAASGVEVGAGTPLKIFEEIGADSEEAALQEILYGTRKGARLEQEAQLGRMAGRNARAEGYSGAVGSILSGGAAIAKGWKHTQRAAPVYEMTSAGPVRID
jgi:hypothetical protein